MASRTTAFDIGSLAAAFTRLSTQLKVDTWDATQPEAARFEQWRVTHTEPNRASVLDILGSAEISDGSIVATTRYSETLIPAISTQPEEITTKSRAYHAMHHPNIGARAYRSNGKHLVAINLVPGHRLWLLESEPATNMTLAHQAHSAITARARLGRHDYRGVVVPNFEIQQQSDIDWLTDAAYGLQVQQVVYPVRSVKQSVDLILDRKLARGYLFPNYREPAFFKRIEPIRFTRPFLGCLTPPGSFVPSIVFYADYDCWLPVMTP